MSSARLPPGAHSSRMQDYIMTPPIESHQVSEPPMPFTFDPSASMDTAASALYDAAMSDILAPNTTTEPIAVPHPQQPLRTEPRAEVHDSYVSNPKSATDSFSTPPWTPDCEPSTTVRETRAATPQTGIDIPPGHAMNLRHVRPSENSAAEVGIPSHQSKLVQRPSEAALQPSEYEIRQVLSSWVTEAPHRTEIERHVPAAKDTSDSPSTISVATEDVVAELGTADLSLGSSMRDEHMAPASSESCAPPPYSAQSSPHLLEAEPFTPEISQSASLQPHPKQQPTELTHNSVVHAARSAASVVAEDALTTEQWELRAARVFADNLPRPRMYGDPPRRDVIGWVASLLERAHTPRWIALCAALRKRHPFGTNTVPSPGAKDGATDADVSQTAVTTAIIEHVVLPLQIGETRRVLTTNIRRHVKRSSVSGLTFMLVFDFHLALFDLANGLNDTHVARLVPREYLGLSRRDGSLLEPDGEAACDMTMADSSCRALLGPVKDLSWQDVIVLNYYVNTAIDRFRAVCGAVGTRHVRDSIERATADFSWSREYVEVCGLDPGQSRVVHLVVLRGSSCEAQTALMRSRFTVFEENDPLVFAAALSTLDPERAILVADKHVGLSHQSGSMTLQRGSTKFVLHAGKSACNIRKMLYTDALVDKKNAGVLTDAGFMHLTQKLTLLNSGLGSGTPGSTWADPWPNWPVLEDTEKQLMSSRYGKGNIVAGGLLCATILANYITGVGNISKVEYLQAIESLKAITDLGDAAAPSYLGVALAQPGLLENVAESTRYMRIAVERGNKNAPAILGKQLQQRGGDAAEASELYKLTIARGGRYGHRYLADMLESGAPGVAQDVAEARRLYEDAAQLGDPVAAEKVASQTWAMR